MMDGLPTLQVLAEIQVTLKSDQLSRPLRQLTASNVSRLVKVSGIITSAQAVRARAVAVKVQCSVCHVVKVRGGRGKGIPYAPPPAHRKPTLLWSSCLL